MSKRGAQLALGSHASEPPLLRQKTEEEADLTLVFPDEVVALILKVVVTEVQPGLAMPVRLVCHRWNTLLQRQEEECRVLCTEPFLEHPASRAARLGHCVLLGYYMDLGKGYRANALAAAAESGHLRAMRLAMDDVSDRSWARRTGARNVQEAATIDASYLSWAFRLAARNGQEAALRLLRERGAVDFHMAWRSALEGPMLTTRRYYGAKAPGPAGRLACMHLLEHWGSSHRTSDLRHRILLVRRGDLDMLRLLNRGGVDASNGLMLMAASLGHLEIVRFLRWEWGATDFQGALDALEKYQCTESTAAVRAQLKEWVE
jgi:hypothetical protein